MADFNIAENNPIALFQQWWQEAVLSAERHDPNAMTLATIDSDGMPHTRVVYLRELIEEGFVFYTNYNSAKSGQLLRCKNVALNFHWNGLDRQVRVCGQAEKAPEEMSDAYFASRGRESQIGAWASPQSETIESREWLMQRVSEMQARFQDQPVPRPPHWGGWLVRPVRIEFWQGRSARLHDRALYEKQGDVWVEKRLAP